MAFKSFGAALLALSGLVATLSPPPVPGHAAEAAQRTRPAAPRPATRGRITAGELGPITLASPEYGPTYRALRSYYPNEFRRLIDLLVDTYNRRGVVAARQAGFDFMLRFMVSKAPSIARASDADLIDVVRVNLALLEHLQGSDPAACARILSTGPTPDMRMTPALLARLNAVNETQLRAASRGEADPTTDRGAMTADDFAALGTRLMDLDPEIATLVAEDRLPQSTTAQQCSAGVLMFRAIADMPLGQAARFIAATMLAAAAARAPST